MNIWIFAAAIGLIIIIIGFISFTGKFVKSKTIKRSTFLLGVFMPVVGALTYSETLITLIPNLSLIDLGAFFIIGMISGFFVALFLVQQNSTESSQA
jgi:tellurite resistance protein TehA-like permease